VFNGRAVDQCGTKLINHDRPGHKQRATRIEIVDDTRKKREDLRRNVSASGQVLTACIEKDGRESLTESAQNQAACFEVLKPCLDQSERMTEFLGENRRIEAFVVSLRHADALEETEIQCEIRVSQHGRSPRRSTQASDRCARRWVSLKPARGLGAGGAMG